MSWLFRTPKCELKEIFTGRWSCVKCSGESLADEDVLCFVHLDFRWGKDGDPYIPNLVVPKICPLLENKRKQIISTLDKNQKKSFDFWLADRERLQKSINTSEKAMQEVKRFMQS